MNTILLVTWEKKRKKLLENILKRDYIIITADKEEKVLLLSEKVDIVILDFVSLGLDGLKLISRMKSREDSLIIIGWRLQAQKEFMKEAKLYGVYEYIDDSLKTEDIRNIIQGAVERRRSYGEIKTPLKLSGGEIEENPADYFPLKDIHRYKNSLKNFSRMLLASFDLDELLNSFLLLLREMLGINRLYILLREKEDYLVRASFGGIKEIIESARFSPQYGLIRYLTKEGTIIDRGRAEDNLLYPEIDREMEIFGAEVAIPLTEKGELLAVLLLGRKVTGKKLTEEELEFLYFLTNQIGMAIENVFLYNKISSQKNYIETILENAETGVITIDEKERIVTFNPKAERILGTEASQIIGKNIRKVPPQIADLLHQTLFTGDACNRHEIKLSPGEYYLGVNTSQLRDGQDQIRGSMMMFTDITPIKRLQKERENTQKRDFLGQVAVRLSHELRNSLVPIKSLVELLPTRYSDREFQKRLFFAVNKEIRRMENLVDRLVFFSEPLYLDRRAESLPDLISETLEKVKKHVPPEKKIELNVDFREDNLQVYVDRKAMVKALNYIITNSVEALVEGGVEIGITCGAVDKLPKNLLVTTKEKKDSEALREYVKIEIGDKGPGLPETATDNNIFDPFFTTKNRGIGLGLTISQSIIKEHEGGIVPLGEVGKGTTMIVYLPRYRVPG